MRRVRYVKFRDRIKQRTLILIDFNGALGPRSLWRFSHWSDFGVARVLIARGNRYANFPIWTNNQRVIAVIVWSPTVRLWNECLSEASNSFGPSDKTSEQRWIVGRAFAARLHTPHHRLSQQRCCQTELRQSA